MQWVYGKHSFGIRETGVRNRSSVKRRWIFPSSFPQHSLPLCLHASVFGYRSDFPIVIVSYLLGYTVTIDSVLSARNVQVDMYVRIFSPYCKRLHVPVASWQLPVTVMNIVAYSRLRVGWTDRTEVIVQAENGSDMWSYERSLNCVASTNSFGGDSAC